MVSKMLAKFALLVALCTIGRCLPVNRAVNTVMEFDCKTLDVSRPIAIYNSMYYLDNGGTLCCPLNSQYCISERRVMEECAAQGRGINYEPCGHCFTCAKNIGEGCYGIEGIHGLCREGLECVGREEDEDKIGACAISGDSPLRQLGEDCGGRFDSLGDCASGLVCTEVMEGSNRVCVMGDQHQQWNESCGGRYGVLGRCDPGEDLHCSADKYESKFLKGADISGTCYGKNQKPNCFSDCSKKPDVYVCATDGVWYRHRCYYRKKNCGLYEQDKIRKHPDETFCGEIPTMKPAPRPTTESREEEEKESRNTSNSTHMVTTEDTHTLQDIEATDKAVENDI